MSDETFDLTDDQSYDMVADYESRLAGELAEAGPEDEVSDVAEDGDEGPSLEDEDFSQDEESPLEEPEGELSDESADQDVTADAPEEPPAPVADPRDDRIRGLEAMVGDLQSKLLDILTATQQHQRQAPAPAPQPRAPEVADEVVRMALFGGNPEEWERVDPATKAKAQKIALDYATREAKYATDPGARYQEVREKVVEDVYRIFGPVIQSHYDRIAQESVQKYAQEFSTESDKARLREVLYQIPGHDSSDPRAFQQAFNLAAERVRVEKKAQEIAEREQRLQAEQRQRDANRQAARRNNRGQRPNKPSAPRNLGPNPSVWDIYQAVKDAET